MLGVVEFVVGWVASGAGYVFAVWLPIASSMQMGLLRNRTSRCSNPTTNAVVDTIATTYPFEIVNDGTYLWASNRTSGTVSKIDPSTDQVIDVIPTGEAVGMAFDGRSVWVAGFSAGNVTRIDPVADKVTRVIALGASPHAAAWDGQYLWVSQFDNSNINKIFVGH